MRTLLLSGSAIALLAGMALGVDAPMKEGLWSIHMVTTMTYAGNVAPITTDATLSRCQGKGTPMQIPGNPPAALECKVTNTSPDGNGTFSKVRCTQNGQTTRMKGTLTMNGENEVHTISDSTFDPPMNGMSGVKQVADWKYVGACAAGVKPEDVVGPDGKVINPPQR